MKRRSRNLRKAEETECWESHPQTTVQGAVDVPPRKRKDPRLKRPPIQDHLRTLRLNQHKAKRASFEAHQEDDPNKQALPTSVRQKNDKEKNSALKKRIDVSLADVENLRRQMAWSVKEMVAPRASQPLLGLGINFCPIPLRPTLSIDKIMERFERALHIRSIFAGSEELILLANPKIYVRSKWTPLAWDIFLALKRRLQKFRKALEPKLRFRPVRQNLLPHQLRTIGLIK